MRTGIKILFVALVLLPLCYFAFQKACSTRPTIDTNDDAVTAQRQGTSNSNTQAAVARADEAPRTSALAPTATAPPSAHELPEPLSAAAATPSLEEQITTGLPNRATEGRRHRARFSLAESLEQTKRPAAMPTPRLQTASDEFAAAMNLDDLATAGSRAGSSGLPPRVPHLYQAMPPTRGRSDTRASNTQRPAAPVALAGGAPRDSELPLDYGRAPASTRQAAAPEITKLSAIVSRTSKERDALSAIKDYEADIKELETAVVANPKQYALLLNEAQVLDLRGVEGYNAALKVTDQTERESELKSAKRDFTLAVELTTKALQIIKAQPPPNEAEGARSEADKLLALAVRAEAMRLYVSKVDGSQLENARAAIVDYIAAEPAAAKKSTAQHGLARLLLETGAFDEALSEYRELLAKNPDDLEAIGNAGIALFNLGAIAENRGRQDEARDHYRLAEVYLKRFVEKTPEGNALGPDVRLALSELIDKADINAAKAASPAGVTTTAPSTPVIPAAPAAPPRPPPRRP